MHVWPSLGTTLGYFVLNIDPILVRLGPLAIRWYGLMYVVAIAVGLYFLSRWTRAQGLHEDQLWGLFIWTALAGLIGGRLYFVVQQPDLVQNYLLNPINIIAVWNGGMAFFGAIFLGAATLFVLAPRYGVDRFLALDGGMFFAAVGQIFGRFGNIINGDILGQAVASAPVAIPGSTCAHAPCISYVADPNILGWAVVYLNPGSFAMQGIPYHPAPVYEMLTNLAMLAVLLPLRYTLPRARAGLFFVLYLALYAIGQFVVFFARGSEPFTPFLGIGWLKQAQWTALFVLLACIPLYLLVRRYARGWPFSAAHPVPWPLPSGGLEAARRARLAEREARAGGTRPGTPAAPVAAQVPAGVGAQAEGMPGWQPVRAAGGRLRNDFFGHGKSNGHGAGDAPGEHDG